jgi:hypothetical protein
LNFTASPSLAYNLKFMKTAHFVLYAVAAVFVGSSKDLLRSKSNRKNTLNAPLNAPPKKTKVSEVAFSFHSSDKRVL